MKNSKEKCFVTFLESPERAEENNCYNKYDGYNHRYIIRNGEWHFGRFPTMEKLREFLDYADVHLKLVDEEIYSDRRCGIYRKWEMDRGIDDTHYFWQLGELPRDAKPFTGLSNGCLVTCYLYNNGKDLEIYRPNPNAKGVYEPLPLEKHRFFCKRNGYV